ncbi:PDZ domain-containing protein [Paenibacillus albiflavus]|uniref:PDZ domain-containing protein n=1 Tax=Paenibacillus albiflavus TaxID=2545760 RepID=A0A4R4ELD3_9BACL|nr:S41 family peptidase [Paenibacillus albiflavus]TCZ81066.1 PDZ domain-containing protein [Paenibacillus albiflavus]
MLNKAARLMKLFLVLMFAAAIVFPATVQAATENETNEIRYLLGNYHVSGITEDKLEGKTVEEMLALLDDPFTTYFTSEQRDQFLNAIENSFVGIGVRLGEDEDGLYISEVFPNMPADLAGLQRDDYITAINGSSVQGKSATDAVNSILGEENTSVRLTVKRGGDLLNISIQRGQVQVPIVVSKRFGQIGYIELSSFSSNGDKEFTKALEQMKADDIGALIIDLRDNGGGYIDTAKNIGANFIKQGVFVHTNDRNQKDIPSIIENGQTFDKPIFLLLNGNSASASEALAGALRDSANATIIGMNSFGKGSMQYMMNLTDGGMLKVTTVEYLTPKNNKVNHVGLKPDVEVYGSMPQMLAALQAAGLSDITIKFNKHHAAINDIDVSDPMPYKVEDGQLYVPSRTLAAMIGADVVWNSKDNTVDIIKGTKKQSYELTKKVVIQADSITYLNVAEFAKTFDTKWSQTGDSWILKVSTK